VSAVLLIGFNRPGNIIERVREISQNSPKHLYISIDKCEDRAIYNEMQVAVNDAIEHYHDSAKVTVIWQPSRLGLARHVKSAIDESLESEKEIIVVEDDVKISTNFVRDMSGAFDTFGNKNDFGTVGGFSGIPFSQSWKQNYWRRTLVFSAWGWMIGQNTWSKYQPQIPPGDIKDQFGDSASWASLSSTQKATWLNRFEKVRSNPSLTWDYQMQYMTFKFDLFHVLPLFRICENLGFGDSRSTNTKNPKPKWMQTEHISEGEFKGELPPFVASVISRRIDSYTISGDSRFRKSINTLRRFSK
jgi:hypothetical protein